MLAGPGRSGNVPRMRSTNQNSAKQGHYGMNAVGETTNKIYSNESFEFIYIYTINFYVMSNFI